MMKDFAIGQSNELVRENALFDLHNQYDFSVLSIGSDGTVRLSFLPNLEHGAGNPRITIAFIGLDYFEISPGFGVRNVQDLEEMGYIPPDQRVDEWLLGEDQATGRDHMVFRFGPDYARIHAKEARLFQHSDATAHDETSLSRSG